jgi:aspartate aminotransferase
VTLAQRILEMEESPTLAVTAKAKALKAAGEPVIGFGAGEPDFPTPRTSSRRRSGRPPTR